jgi:amino-acid N-acetyltransferase
MAPRFKKYQPKYKDVLMSEAERIIARFGGARALAAALKKIGKDRDPASIYRWTYPIEDGGTGGAVPSSARGDVNDAARLYGIILTAEDWLPFPTIKKVEVKQKRGRPKKLKTKF